MNEEPSLELTIWYPAVDGEEDATSYPYQVKLPVVGAVTLATDASYAVPDAAYDLAAGPYPLVILSPGFAMSGSSYGWLAEQLASHGFVVLAPEHDEQMNPESDLWQGAVKRPQDIQAVLAFVDDQVKPGSSLAGLVDPEVVAVIGHSYGGYTALAAAGARIDSAGLTTHCQEAAQANHPAAWLCDMLLPNLPDMAALAGFDTLPDELWPGWSNPRVDAIVSMAGDAFFFGETGLAEINVPVLAIGGTADNDSPFLWGTQPTYEYVSSPRKAQVALNDAEHMIFTNNCDAIRWYAKPLAGEFCADTAWDRQQAHDLIGHFTTAFLLAELKQDHDAAAALAPDAVEFSKVTYATEGY
jgi:predicted dienelactone hydrolase